MASEKIIIPLPLCTLNDYINIERRNRYNAAKLKNQATDTVCMWTQGAMRKGVAFKWGRPLHFDWYWYNKRTDPDNIAFQKKFILDGFQRADFLDNDNWDNIGGFTDRFFVDAVTPRVEVYEDAGTSSE